MIYLYTGTPGSGKSLHVADRILGSMRYHSDPVICNFPCNFDKYKKLKGQFIYLDNMDLTPGALVSFSKAYSEHVGRPLREGEILLIVDECQVLYNARDFGRKDMLEWVKFYSQHRKLGYEVILVAQFDRMIDRQIRSLVEYQWIHRKLKNAGWWCKLVAFLFGGKLFVSVKVWYPMKQKVGSEFFFYNRKKGGIYDTFALFDSSKG